MRSKNVVAFVRVDVVLVKILAVLRILTKSLLREPRKLLFRKLVDSFVYSYLALRWEENGLTS